MKAKVFCHLFANLVLIAVVVVVCSVGLIGATANVFSKDEYSPIYRGSATDKVALMINVYWGNEYLEGFLEVFQRYNIKTTFFVGGQWAAQNPQLLQRIVDDGHEIGNHGFYHKSHSKLTYQQSADDIVACNKIIYELCGVRVSLFAPPSGDFCNATLKAAKDNSLKTIMWSRDTIDWRDKDSQLVFTRATKDTSGGELILMHPTAHTLQALEKIVKYYLDKGLQPTTVGDIIGGLWTSTNSTQVGCALSPKSLTATR